MSIVAVRINTVQGAKFNEDGELTEGQLNDSEEQIVYVDTSDVFDILNGIVDIRDMLDNWTSGPQLEVGSIKQ